MPNSFGWLEIYLVSVAINSFLVYLYDMLKDFLLQLDPNPVLKSWVFIYLVCDSIRLLFIYILSIQQEGRWRL